MIETFVTVLAWILLVVDLLIIGSVFWQFYRLSPYLQMRAKVRIAPFISISLLLSSAWLMSYYVFN